MIIPLQVEAAGTKLLDYGIIGIALVFVGFFAWYLFKKVEKDGDLWRAESSKMNDNFITLVTEQNKTNQRLIDIREKDVAQNKDFHDSMKKSVEDLPAQTIRELKYHNLQAQQTHNNPAG
jgi:hypothetical protein